MPFAHPSSLPFPSHFEFRCSDPVGEGERGRPFPLPFLFGSCLLAHESPHGHWPFVIRMQSTLSELFLACALPLLFDCPLLGAPSAGLSSSRFLDFLLEMSLAHQLQCAVVVFLVAECRLLSANLQHIFQRFRLFNLHLVQTLQYVVSRSVSDC